VFSFTLHPNGERIDGGGTKNKGKDSGGSRWIVKKPSHW